MKKKPTAARQSSAFDAIGSLLHLDRRRIVVLIIDRDHPLPLPQRSASEREHLTNRQYLHQLIAWIRGEKSRAASHLPPGYDLERIQWELEGKCKGVCVETNWSIERALATYPPGNFLG